MRDGVLFEQVVTRNGHINGYDTFIFIWRKLLKKLDDVKKECKYKRLYKKLTIKPSSV